MSLDLAPALALLHARLPGLVSVYLFGSHAAGLARADSDVDLAFYARRALPREHVFALAGDLAELLRRDVDLVDLAAAPTILQMQAIGEGTLLAAPDSLAAALFEVRVMRDYQDLKERRAEIEADIAARGRVHA
jgi:predicted nucleotidyltransferase